MKQTTYRICQVATIAALGVWIVGFLYAAIMLADAPPAKFLLLFSTICWSTWGFGAVGVITGIITIGNDKQNRGAGNLVLLNSLLMLLTLLMSLYFSVRL